MNLQPIKAHRQEPVVQAGARGAHIRMLIGPDDGAPNFYMRHFELEPGGCTPHHEHPHEHEVLVWRGTGIAKSEQGDRPFKPGDVIFIPGGEKHQFCNDSSEPCEFICLVPSNGQCACDPNDQ